ncbi:type I restriction endonuclease [Roseateles sp. UC29_93]|uniref:type I restriction endonuclease n=1 Tax=Roseateles sp. UC29_93 TaxID=3350177 RepID=UPI00366FC41B
MDFIDQLRVLSTRIANTKALIQTEEATKNAMVMPFIQALGYNVFDPLEVTPELVADVGTKKGEKVDYAILRAGKPIMLFECKKAGGDLSINHAGQLFRYFHVTEARFGVLTNGLVYRFFTDLEQPNKMDEKPFFEFNILDFNERDVEELKKFAKAAFDLETILTTANELKYTRAIQTRLAEWMINPAEEFVRLVSSDLLGTRRFTPAIKDQFTLITRRAFEQLLGERINDRLKGAMAPETVSVPDPIVVAAPSAPVLPPASIPDEPQVVTTPEELEAFHTVRALVRNLVPSKRVVMRDAQSYCAILLDDNNRKPVCRLRFNNTQKLRLGLFSADKSEEQFSLESVDDIHNFADQLRATVASYLQPAAS